MFHKERYSKNDDVVDDDNFWSLFCCCFFYQNIFKNVEVLIYLFDVESREIEKDVHYYQNCLEGIMQYSKDTKVFCLIHKMDLIPDDQRDIVRKI